MSPARTQTAEVDIGAPLGATLARLARGGDRELLQRTVALLCRERDQGHVCISLAQWQGSRGAEDGMTFPTAKDWRDQLQATGLCNAGATDEAPLPLVLDARDRLYLLRHFRAEQRILHFLQDRLSRPPAIGAQTLREALEVLGLLPESQTEPDWQLAAIAAAARCSFALLTGGPGTGKTTTVARLLAVLLHLTPDLRIALAAPTGKAAARLGEALRERAADFPSLRAAAERLQPKTLHRLLGYLPLEDAFRAGPDQPLPYDLVVIDEASMVDPAVLAALFGALRPEARLLLVGDRDQLAAVAAGQVLGDLCRAARPEAGVGAELAAFVRQATGMNLPQQEAAPPIADCVIALQKNHRFGKQPGIGGFAQALARRDAKAAMQVLEHGHRDLRLEPDTDRALQAIADELFAATVAASPDAALALLATVRVLTATRYGHTGAEAWNRRVEALLATRGVRTDDRWYNGRPILVLQNDHQNQIWNGDLGVAWRTDDDRPHVFFPVVGAEARMIAVQRLPAHETAWAMTVHKAQGSEFQTVLLAMPDVPGPLWQPSLVYTGITRARERAILCADPALLRACLPDWPTRSSGLAAGLGVVD
jgi:exodeoxyribonuclease V alpha subunit